MGVKLHLVALVLGGKGVAEAQPCRREGGVHGGGLAKVLPRAVEAADGLVVAPHAKPGHSMLRVVLHQPCSGNARKWKRHSGVWLCMPASLKLMQPDDSLVMQRRYDRAFTQYKNNAVCLQPFQSAWRENGEQGQSLAAQVCSIPCVRERSLVRIVPSDADDDAASHTTQRGVLVPN